MKATNSFKVTALGTTTQIDYTNAADSLEISDSSDLFKLTNAQLVELFSNMSADALLERPAKLTRFATKKIGAQKIIRLFNAKLATKATVLKKSTTSDVIMKAWDIFRAHMTSTRAQILELCTAAGIAKGTASTQWWKFRKQNGLI